MYGHNNEFLYGYSMDYVDNFNPLSDVTHPPILPSTTIPVPIEIPNNEYDSISALKAEVGYSSSGCSSYGSPSSLTNYGTNNTSFLQRSTSTLSLQKNVEAPEGFFPFVSSPTTYADSESSSVRKVFSTGDLQGMNLLQRNHGLDSSLSNEMSIIESMSKASKYSPEEKKEKIERYRSKRNLRNFNKKIKYECRKTLADSRPRIRGRFARNDEIEKTAHQNEWGDPCVVEEDQEYQDDNNWVNFLDSYSENLIP